MPSVASNVSTAIAQHRDAKVSSSASNADDRADASPFAEMLDSSVAPKDPAPAKSSKAATQNATTSKKAASTPKSQPSPQAEPQSKDAAGLPATAETNSDKKADVVQDAALTLEPTSVAVTLPQPSEPPQVDLAAFMEAVAAATQPQAPAETHEAKADKTEPDEAQAAEGSTGDAADQPVLAAPTDPVAVAVTTALPVDQNAAAPGDAVDQPADLKVASSTDATAASVVSAAVDQNVDAAPQAADSANNTVEQATPAEPGKPAPALTEAAGTAAKPANETRPVTASSASEAKSEAQKSVAVDPLAASVVDAKAGKSETPKTQAAAKADPAKSETPVQADAVRPADTPVALAAEAKPAAAQAHQAAHKAREAVDAPAKPDAASDLVSTQKPADSGPALTLPAQAGVNAASATASVSPQKDTAASAAAVPIDGVAVEIAARAIEGKHHFDIRLDPPELGRIHVRLDIDRNGEITSRVMTDRQDTLDLLRRDASQLERALNDAGLRTSGNGLQFSLRDHGHGQREQSYFADAARVIVKDDNLAAEALPRGYYRPAGAAGGIDIRV